MTDRDILTLVKANLGITRTAWDDYLLALIGAAKQMITREGVTISDTLEDTNLIVMYTSYLWRKRAEDAPMPRMLRWALNNRIMSEKAVAE